MNVQTQTLKQVTVTALCSYISTVWWKQVLGTVDKAAHVQNKHFLRKSLELLWCPKTAQEESEHVFEDNLRILGSDNPVFTLNTIVLD